MDADFAFDPEMDHDASFVLEPLNVELVVLDLAVVPFASVASEGAVVDLAFDLVAGLEECLVVDLMGVLGVLEAEFVVALRYFRQFAFDLDLEAVLEFARVVHEVHEVLVVLVLLVILEVLVVLEVALEVV